MKRAYPSLVDLPDRYCVQRIHALPAVLARLDKVSFTQDIEMLHHPEPGDVGEGLNNLSRRTWTLAHQIQNRATRWIRQCLPHRVELVLGRKCNHALLAVLFHQIERVLPPCGHALAMLRIDHSDGAMPQCYPRASGSLLDLDLQMVGRRIRHEHRSTQLKQHRRLDYLHESPQ